MLRIIFILTCCCSCPAVINGQDAANFVVEQYYYCEDMPNPIVNLSVMPKTFEPRTQIMDVNLNTPIPLGNELRFGATAEIEITIMNKKHWQYMFSVEDNFCRTIQMYLGEMLYELEMRWGLLRGSCPIPKGHYHAVNYTLDFSRMKLQAFPSGKLRIVFHILEKSKRDELLCSVFIVSNKS